MRDYSRIINKITSTPWLITPEALNLILNIANERIANGRLDDETIDARLNGIGARPSENDQLNIHNGVGVLSIAGPIFGKANLMTRMSGATSLETFHKDFRELLANDNVHSIVLDMDTPGGTSDLVQETGEEILAGRDTKPIYAISNTMIGSAGLWLASQATKMYSTSSGSVGSLGAYTVHQDQSGRDTQQGIKFTYTSAGPYKTEGNPHEPLSQEATDYRQEVVDELYGDFVAAVANGRGTSVELVKENYGGGRMLTAKRALDAGMIDGIMPFDNLVSTLGASQPRTVSVVFTNGERASALLIGNELRLGSSNLEVAEWEHSEPGTGSPPIPIGANDEADRSGDNKGTGSRRVTPPIQNPNSDTVQNNMSNPSEHGEEETQMKLSKAVRDMLGLSADATDEQATTAIETFVMATAANTPTATELSFAEQFPEQHAELMEGRAERFNVRGQSFAEGFRYFTTGVGEEKTTTNKGLSALALDKIKDTHVLIAMGSTDEALESLGSMLGVITGDAGITTYGERGSSRPLSDDNDTGNAADTTGKDRSAKWKFDAAVKATQKEAGGPSKMSWGDAVSATTRDNPELALAYQEEMSANRENNS